jgi:hypothetical protein
MSKLGAPNLKVLGYQDQLKLTWFEKIASKISEVLMQ